MPSVPLSSIIATAEVHGKRRIVIPKRVAELLDVREGDIVVFYRCGNGEVCIAASKPNRYSGGLV